MPQKLYLRSDLGPLRARHLTARCPSPVHKPHLLPLPRRGALKLGLFLAVVGAGLAMMTTTPPRLRRLHQVRVFGGGKVEGVGTEFRVGPARALEFVRFGPVFGQVVEEAA